MFSNIIVLIIICLHGSTAFQSPKVSIGRCQTSIISTPSINNNNNNNKRKNQFSGISSLSFSSSCYTSSSLSSPSPPPSPVVSTTKLPNHSGSTTKTTTKTTTTTTTTTSLHLTPLQGDILRTTLGAALAAKIALSGLKKQSLRTSGAISAFLVATLSLGCSIRSGATLLLFYLTGSKLTKIGSSLKQTLEEDYKVGGKRGARQVLACSLIAVVAAILRRILVGPDSPLDFVNLSCLGNQFTLAYVGFFACCAGDTWASELGILSKSPPRLVIPPFQKVAPGTNGGISKVGSAASAAGGVAMGIIHGIFLPIKYSTPEQRLREIIALAVVGFIGGLGGSLIDSILGATIQITHYDPVEKIILKKPKEGSIKLGCSLLSNEMVNVVSTAMTAILAAIYAKPLLSLISILI